MRPAVPAPLRPTLAVLAAMLAASLANLALVDNRTVQLLAVLPIVLGGAVILGVLQQRQARRLGVRASTDLPEPLGPRMTLSTLLAAAAVALLLATNHFFTGWWAVWGIAWLAANDLIRRQALASVLRGEGTVPRRPPSLAKLGLGLVVLFCVQVGLFGWLMTLARQEPLTAGNIIANGLLFGVLMTAFFAVVALVERRRSRSEERPLSPTRP